MQKPHKIYHFHHTKKGGLMKKIDYKIIIILVLFMIISCTTIYSAMTYLSGSLGNLALKQFIFYLLGFIVIFILTKLPKSCYEKTIWIFYIIGNILLLLLLFIGKDINGSKCWFIIPGIGSFQPSEFMKIILIITIANVTHSFFEKKKNPTTREEFIFLLKILAVLFIPSILTFLEPDTGAVIIYFLITCGILLISPLKRKWFWIGFGLCACIIIIFFYFFFFKQETFVNILGTDFFYRVERILDWKKGEGLQLENSLVSIGSSGILGHGYNKTPLYFPESGTDFIFAVFISNFGLLGSIILIGLIILFDIHLLNLAKEENNLFYKYIIIGTVSMFLYQQIQNISMTFGLLPITGITLPFISYGGSSLLSYFLIIGIIENIYAQNKKKSIYKTRND